MRVVGKLLYLVVLAICGLGIHGARTHPRVTPPVYPSVSLNLTGADTYGPFLRALQEKVILGNHTAFDLPVLNPESQVSDSNRFVLVPLTNPSGDTVTLAIDVVNLYVVAFSSNGRSYFFSGSTAVQKDNLFVDTTQEDLNFTGNYTSLERQVGSGRVDIPLGPESLAQAISSLRTYTLSAGDTKPLARGLLVVIQMVSEAARFRYIELRIWTSITDASEFKPDPLMLSMENKWSFMSKEIQGAQRGGTFTHVVQLQDQGNNPIEVTNFSRLFQLTYIAVLLYGCPFFRNPIDAQIIKMPVFRGGEYDDVCSVVEVTRRISGWDGLCVDVRGGQYIEGQPVQLWPCGNECNQLWTFRSDGTIRWLGKCLIATSYVTIRDCYNMPQELTKWVVSIDGTITNPYFGRVLTARVGVQRRSLLLEENIHAATQGWTVGEVEPLVTFIVGYNQMCLRSNTQNNPVWLENCVLNRTEQMWALYGDGTIRVNSDRSLCVTSDGHSTSDLIIISKCQGSSNERWVFNTNGTISNPNAKLVMDVKQSDVSLRQIILHQPTGNPNQQWITDTDPV